MCVSCLSIQAKKTKTPQGTVQTKLLGLFELHKLFQVNLQNVNYKTPVGFEEAVKKSKKTNVMEFHYPTSCAYFYGGAKEFLLFFLKPLHVIFARIYIFPDSIMLSEYAVQHSTCTEAFRNSSVLYFGVSDKLHSFNC